MSKINFANIQKQLSRVEAEYEDTAILSKPMSLNINEIIVNPDNIAAAHDDEESIRNLADSIEASGLIHPLTVNRIGEHKYMLLSGERRFKAITTFLDWESIPCTVYENLDKDMTVLVTVQANMETREYSVADRLALYSQLDIALHNLKAEGKFKGGVGRAIAKMMGVSERQISAYKKIIKNTTDEQRKEITNINRAVENIRQSEKTYAERKFSEKKPPVPEPTQPTTNNLDDELFKADIWLSSVIRKLNDLSELNLFNDVDRESFDIVINAVSKIKKKYTT